MPFSRHLQWETIPMQPNSALQILSTIHVTVVLVDWYLEKTR